MKHLYCILIICFFLVSCKKDENARRPNILWLIIEDFSPDLSCYGYDQVRTPNIDKLANEGTRFTNAFTTAPVCSASRSAFMTGMYQTSIGAHHHRSHREDGYSLPDSILTAPEYFAKAGYYTSNVKRGFSSFKGTSKTDLNFEHKGIFPGKDWDSLKVNQPFFAQVNFAPVHRMMYKMPDTLTVNPELVELPPYYPDHPIARLDWAKYLTKIELLDGMVGEVIEKLEQDGLAENTIVVLMADHGRNHIRGKQWLYDPGIHIPLIVRKPNQKKSQVDDRFVSALDLLPTLLELSDLNIPDFMEGVSFVSDQYEGREYIIAARDRCDESVEYIRSVRDQQFKYVKNFMPDIPYTQPNKYKEAYYPMWLLMRKLKDEGKLNADQLKFWDDFKPKEELYDITTDPYELNNLASDPGFEKVLLKMRVRLRNWQNSTNDLGMHSEDSVSLNYWKRKIEEWDVSERIEAIQAQISEVQ